MNLCPMCGDKRCPRATDHRNECTGSNENMYPELEFGSTVFPKAISGTYGDSDECPCGRRYLTNWRRAKMSKDYRYTIDGES